MSRAPFSLERDHVLLLDQTLLPEREEWIQVRSAAEMALAIERLQVRGAPAIGIAAALALAVEASRAAEAGGIARLEEAGRLLAGARPTAVNLSWAVDRILRAAREACRGAERAPLDEAVRSEALRLWEEDRAASEAIARHGVSLFPRERRFLTHCHTGPLATGGGGTALGILLELHRRRSGGIEVWATETRPLLQGARLTAWELRREGVPFRLITDGAAAHAILHEGIEAVVVGADRIARNGDTANKIGTLALALAAREAGVPLVVVAPSSSVDPSLPDGSGIRIEERPPAEVTTIRGVAIAPEGAPVRNPAFDVTPARLIAAIVTERGVFRGPAYDLGPVVDREAGR